MPLDFGQVFRYVFFMNVEKRSIDARDVILYRTLPGLTRRVQERMGSDAGVLYTYDTDERGPLEIERFVKEVRPGDTCWLPSLLCLVIPPKFREEKYSPSADLGSKVASLLARGATVIDIRGRGKGAISSADATIFAAHVAYCIGHASQGERLKKRARKKRTRAPKGITARWLSPAMAEQLEAQKIIWTSTRLSIEKKLKRLDPELAELGESTLYGILGEQFPGIKGKGGRPPKRKS